MSRSIIATEAKSYEKFVQFISDSNSTETNFSEIVGEFHIEDEVSVDFGQMFTLFGKHVARDWTAMQIAASSGSASLVRCDQLCAAGCLLPLAKMVVHVGAWVKDIANRMSTCEAPCVPCALVCHTPLFCLSIVN